MQILCNLNPMLCTGLKLVLSYKDHRLMLLENTKLRTLRPWEETMENEKRCKQ